MSNEVVVCLQRDANDWHMVQLTPLVYHIICCFTKNPEWSTFQVPVHPCCRFAGKKAVKRTRR